MTLETTRVEWDDVPDERLAAWRLIFGESRESLNLSSTCPVCGKTALHRWYMVGRPVDYSASGTRFVARGALWEWCSACGSFQHYSALVPEWWESDLVVDTGAIRITPDPIEQARRDREIESKSPESPGTDKA